MNGNENAFKRMSWAEGWHEDGKLDYYIENGCLISGVMHGRTVYPYVQCATGGYNNASGIKANKRNYDRVIWL